MWDVSLASIDSAFRVRNKVPAKPVVVLLMCSTISKSLRINELPSIGILESRRPFSGIFGPLPFLKGNVSAANCELVSFRWVAISLVTFYFRVKACINRYTRRSNVAVHHRRKMRKPIPATGIGLSPIWGKTPHFCTFSATPNRRNFSNMCPHRARNRARTP